MHVPKDRYEEIRRRIEAKDSPVGIDAKETHIIIINLLLDLEERLTRLERKLEAGNVRG